MAITSSACGVFMWNILLGIEYFARDRYPIGLCIPESTKNLHFLIDQT